MMKTIAILIACAGMAFGQTYNPDHDGEPFTVTGPNDGNLRSLTAEEYVQIYGIRAYTKADAEEIVRALQDLVGYRVMTFNDKTGDAAWLSQTETKMLQSLYDKWRKRLEEMK